MNKYKSWFIFSSKLVILMFSDFLAYFCSFSIALFIRDIIPSIFSDIQFPHFSHIYYQNPESWFFLLIIFAVFLIKELYYCQRTFWNEFLIIEKYLFVSVLLSYLVLFNFPIFLPLLSRLLLVILFLLLLIFIPLFRLIIKFFVLSRSIFQIPVIIVSDQDEMDNIVNLTNFLNRDFYFGFKPIGFFDYTGNGCQHPYLHTYQSIDQLPLDMTVFLACKDTQSQAISELYARYNVIYAIPYKSGILVNADNQYLFSERLFVIKFENKLNSLTAGFFKLLMDKVLSFLIIICISPLIILVILLIKLTSPGPIFYHQTRVGKGGKSFKIFKFRTMHLDADQKLKVLLEENPVLKLEWEKYYKLKKDPRITPIGGFLRKYSIDELPQLFNVLLGSMSLVGPRPFVLGEIEEIDPNLLTTYAKVKPGLTGLWQVTGRNNNDRIQRIKIDMWYIQNWKLSLDIIILLNTPLSVLRAEGAS
ncbi:MAG: exopolysaccharide biosynthesis polyprenyl glycosylphosphotransferase [Brevinemataceae bacterium]